MALTATTAQLWNDVAPDFPVRLKGKRLLGNELQRAFLLGSLADYVEDQHLSIQNPNGLILPAVGSKGRAWCGAYGSSNNYLKSARVTQTDQIAFEAIFEVDAFQTTIFPYLSGIISMYHETASPQAGPTLRFNDNATSGHAAYLTFFIVQSGTEYSATTDYALDASTPYHVIGSYDGATVALWVRNMRTGVITKHTNSRSGAFTNATGNFISLLTDYSSASAGSQNRCLNGKIFLANVWRWGFSNTAALARFDDPFGGVYDPLTQSVLFLSGSSGVSLESSDSIHGHAADTLVLSTALGLTINDATHGHAADNIALSAALSLSIAETLHSHLADNLTLSSGLDLAPSDALHGHIADAPTLDTAVSLIVQDSDHTHAADNVTLSAALSLAIAEALHAHGADNITLDGANTLAVQEALHGHTADALTLSAALALVVADALHGHAADIVGIETGVSLAIQDAAHSHTTDAVTLSSALSLLVQDAAHGHISDEVVLTAALSLLVADAVHTHSSENVAVDTGSALTIQNVLHSHIAENALLSSAMSLLVADAGHDHSAEILDLISELALIVAEARHTHTADNIVFNSASAYSIIRAYLVLAENRQANVDPETRGFVVLS